MSSYRYVNTNLVASLVEKIFKSNESSEPDSDVSESCRGSVKGMCACLEELAVLTKCVWDSALSASEYENQR